MTQEQRKRLLIAFPELSAALSLGAQEESSEKSDTLALILSKISQMKGEKGDSPTQGELLDLIIPLIPEVKDGEDYVLTEEDRKQIAASIEVPVFEKVIEKTKVIEKIPVVTEITKEVLPEDLAKALNSMKGALDVSVVKGAVSKKDLEESSKGVLAGMEKIDGRVKAIDMRWRGGGLSSVSHDSTLTGLGTPSSPLSVLAAGTPGGSTTQIQYNNAGSFGGISGFTSNGTSANFTNALLAGGSAGTSGSLLVSSGAGIAPAWIPTATLGLLTGGSSGGRVAYWNGITTLTGTAGFQFASGSLTVPTNITATGGSVNAGDSVTAANTIVSGGSIAASTDVYGDTHTSGAASYSPLFQAGDFIMNNSFQLGDVNGAGQSVHVYSNGNEVMTVNPSDVTVTGDQYVTGKIGVGTSSPNSPLHIVGVAGSYGQLNIDSLSTSAQSNFAISKGGTRYWVVYTPGTDDTFRWYGSIAGADAVVMSQSGFLYTTGTGSGIGFKDRGTSTVWQWYSSGDVARLYGGADRLSISTAGLMTVSMAAVNSTTATGQYIVNPGTGFSTGSSLKIGYAATQAATAGISGFYDASAQMAFTLDAGAAAVATGFADGNFQVNAGNLKVSTAGKGLFIKEGTNAKMGTATLVAGTVVVSTTAVTANSRIFLTAQSLGTVTIGQGLAVSARTAGTSFTILSASAVDTSVVAWVIYEPA